MLETIRRIIVPTDFSDLSDVAIRSAASLARQDAASIHLLHVIRLPFLHTNYDVNIPERVWENMRKHAREKMHESSVRLQEAGIGEVDLLFSESLQPAEAVAQFAKKLDVDLVIMATHGRRGLEHAFLGSTTERTIRTSPIPVLAINKGAGVIEVPLRRILLPTDFSFHAKQATSLARSLAGRFGAHIDVLHVIDGALDYLARVSTEVLDVENQIRATADEHLDAVGAQMTKMNVSAKTHLRKGVAADVIAEEADRLESDLIVMGTHGLTGLKHAAIGSVTERSLRLAPCSVLTTRDASEESADVE